jgi:hypothetical protein
MRGPLLLKSNERFVIVVYETLPIAGRERNKKLRARCID